ncbi:MAG: DUF4406 domain-containing protein [Chitinispirillaceae bacterium]|nr:DUF4406 domain-containing protein [Chitinispirillaceae bacterium]
MAYVAGKYMASTREKKLANVSQADELGKKLLMMGVCPVIPHKITALWDEDERFTEWDSDMWLNRYCYILLSNCHILVACKNYTNSYGAKKEIEMARDLGMPVIFYENDEQLRDEIGKILEDFL